MGKYAVDIISKAEKEFLKLPEVMRERIREKILLLEDNPRPLGSKKLRDTEYYRIRIGDFRVLYRINYQESKIIILKIDKRERVY